MDIDYSVFLIMICLDIMLYFIESINTVVIILLIFASTRIKITSYVFDLADLLVSSSF